MKQTLLGLIIICVLISCNEEKKWSKAEIFASTFPDAIDEIVGPAPEEKKYIFYTKVGDDDFKYSFLKDHIEKMSDSSKIEVAKKLLLHYEDSVVLPSKPIQTKRFDFYGNDRQIDSLLESNMDQALGFVDLSAPVLNKDEDFGGYYVSPNLGEYKGGMYLVYVKKVNENWQYVDYDTLALAE